jgi:two-component system response regulator YesN
MKRITVMLVDDEPLALENVYDLVPWEENGFEVIAKMTDSRKAWELFQKIRAQIVILDISMPHMDGLELGRRIHEAEPLTQLLYLTAYRDFDYARQALELKACNYMLKHEISHNRLLEELLTISHGLETKEMDWISAKRQMIRDLIFRKKRTISERLTTTVYKQVWSNIQGPLALLYFEPEPSLHLNGQKSYTTVNNEELLWSRLNARVLYECESLIWIDALSNEENGFVVLLQLPGHNSFLYNWNAVQTVAQMVQKELLELEGWIPPVCFSINCTREKLHSTYIAVKEFYDYLFMLPPKPIFALEQMLKVEDIAVPVRIAVRQISDALQQNNASLLNLHFHSLFEELIMSRMNYKGLLFAVKELGTLLVERNQNLTEQILGSDGPTIVSTLNRLLESSLDTLPLQQNSYSRWVMKAIDYVKSHYDDPGLSLESVAEHLQISSIHLRITFKKEMGITLLDYTTEYRIERAKELLKQGNYKIYTISEKVGYKTSQYFSQVFKKITGVHPKDYI